MRQAVSVIAEVATLDVLTDGPSISTSTSLSSAAAFGTSISVVTYGASDMFAVYIYIGMYCSTSLYDTMTTQSVPSAEKKQSKKHPKISDERQRVNRTD